MHSVKRRAATAAQFVEESWLYLFGRFIFFGGTFGVLCFFFFYYYFLKGGSAAAVAAAAASVSCANHSLFAAPVSALFPDVCVS